MRLQDYLALVNRMKAEHPEWRAGQTYFNVLRDTRPDLSEKIRTTGLDPFHDDRNIVAFMAWVAENWKVLEQ